MYCELCKHKLFSFQVIAFVFKFLFTGHIHTNNQPTPCLHTLCCINDLFYNFLCCCQNVARKKIKKGDKRIACHADIQILIQSTESISSIDLRLVN